MKEIVFPYEHVGTLGYLNYSLMQGAFFFSNVGDYVWNKERSGVVIVDGIECRVNDVAINVDLDSDFESGEIYDDRDVLSDAEMVQKFLKPNMMAFLTNRRVLVGWDFTKTAVQVLMRNVEFRDWVGEDRARVLQNVYNISLAFGNSVDDNMDDIAEAGIDSTAAAATTDIGADDASTITDIAADNAIATTGIATDDAAATTDIAADDTAATTGIATDDAATTDVVEVEHYKVASVPATLKTDKAKEFYALIDSQDEDDVAAVQEFDSARHQWYAAEPAHKEVALSEYKRHKKCVQQVFIRRLAQLDFLLGRRMCAKRRRRFNSLYSIILKMYSDNWETETQTNSRHQRLQQHTRRPSPQERHKSELKKQMHAILASMRKNKRSDRNYLARSAKREAANRAKLDAITRRMDLEL